VTTPTTSEQLKSRLINTSTEDAEEIPGQGVYTPFFLRYVYDPLVVHFANRFTWRCPSRTLLDLYDAHVSGDHLEVGPGTGWYLDRCKFPARSPRLALMDINANVLARSAKRLIRYRPSEYVVNLLKPKQIGDRKFDSIAMTHVLHCLPGSTQDKARALDYLQSLLRPGGVLFGSTILYGGVPQTPLSLSQLHQLNRQRVLNNLHDSLDTLDTALGQRFTKHTLCSVGSVGLFVAFA
jgi:SAM-dependent methyltransferase